LRLYTLGQSDRSRREFLALLKENRIERLVDCRRFPTSSRSPHCHWKGLAADLDGAGIEYVWMEEALGGYRTEGLEEDSPNEA